MNKNKKVSMEYEARVMVNESQYLKIKQDYRNIGGICKEFTNINTYFDTPDLYLTSHHMVLRIREIITNDKSEKELTLKIKGENGDIEITHIIEDEIEYQNLLSINIDSKDILEELSHRGIDPQKLKIITTLTTERIEVSFSNYLLVIDKNFYNGKIDFNIEVESTSRELAKQYLIDVISKYDIEYKKDYISKSRRAIYKL